MSNPFADEQEPAEGSRETAIQNAEEGAGERMDPADTQGDGAGPDAGGITNRPLQEEIENQRELPPRGTAKNPEEDHA
jgi:hypothetical protein